MKSNNSLKTLIEFEQAIESRRHFFRKIQIIEYNLKDKDETNYSLSDDEISDIQKNICCKESI